MKGHNGLTYVGQVNKKRTTGTKLPILRVQNDKIPLNGNYLETIIKYYQ